MSYSFTPGVIYRMPTHFGPAPGPRQRPDGGRYHNRDRPLTTTAWLETRVDGDQVARHLPPGFVPDPDPRMLIEVRYRRELDWLAGRGYNIVMVSWAAQWQSGDRRLPGRLQAAVWENLADSIITGRDELGIAKLFADIPELDFDGTIGTATCSASWDGFEFVRLELSGLHDTTPEHDVVGPDYFQWRHFPRPGHPGEADVSYPVTTPGEQPHRRVLRAMAGTGTVRFNPATFEQLPTLFHIVNGLSELNLLDTCSAGLIETRGSRDLSDQHALEAG